MSPPPYAAERKRGSTCLLQKKELNMAVAVVVAVAVAVAEVTPPLHFVAHCSSHSLSTVQFKHFWQISCVFFFFS
jgi:hypothetical protein